jgi:hypothetical protein
MFEHTQKLFFRRRPSRSIRPTGIRCFATLVEDISCFATLVEDISCFATLVEDISCFATFVLQHILPFSMELFPIFIKNYQ